MGDCQCPSSGDTLVFIEEDLIIPGRDMFDQERNLKDTCLASCNGETDNVEIRNFDSKCFCFEAG